MRLAPGGYIAPTGPSQAQRLDRPSHVPDQNILSPSGDIRYRSRSDQNRTCSEFFDVCLFFNSASSRGEEVIAVTYIPCSFWCLSASFCGVDRGHRLKSHSYCQPCALTRKGMDSGASWLKRRSWFRDKLWRDVSSAWKTEIPVPRDEECIEWIGSTRGSCAS